MRKVHVARVLFQALLALAGLAVFWLVGRSLGGYVPQFAGWVRGLGAWGPAVFIVGYAAAGVAFVPGSLLTLAAGAIFGIVFGVAYVFLGAMLATVAVTAVVTRLARRSLQEATE